MTPAGPFALIESGTGAISADWLDGDSGEGGLPPGARHDPEMRPGLSDRLARYFAGEAVDFDDVPTPPGSSFDRRCWEACRRIRRGGTRTYAQLAALAGSGPGAARAAGQAMRRNPLPVIVPCHRVVASGGTLHGYGGSRDPEGRALGIKRRLLQIEGATFLGEEATEPSKMRTATR